MKDSSQDSLDERLAGLARDIVPPDTLWPAIARSIGGRPRRTRPLLLAAALASACVGGALTWAVLHERATPSLVAVNQPPQAPNFAEPQRPQFLAARSDLEATFQDRLRLLKPDTRAKIEASLGVIRQAHEDIRKALAAEPANPLLEGLFESTLHDEFDLYDQVVQATQPNLTRT